MVSPRSPSGDVGFLSGKKLTSDAGVVMFLFEGKTSGRVAKPETGNPKHECRGRTTQNISSFELPSSLAEAPPKRCAKKTRICVFFSHSLPVFRLRFSLPVIRIWSFILPPLTLFDRTDTVRLP